METDLKHNKHKILEVNLITPETINKNSKHIVMIHGFATNSKSWELFAKRNENNFLHLINLPGHGVGEYTKRDLDFDNIVKSIVDYILDIDAKSIILIGHSFGGGISMVVNYKLKKLQNNKIEKLILLAPYTKFSIPKVYNKIPLFNVKTPEDFLELQKEIFQNAKKTLKKLQKYFYEKESLTFFKSNWKYLKYIIFQMSRPTTFVKINTAMEAIGDNTYLLLGENDKLVPSNIISTKFREIKPKMYISIYKECGHAFFAERDIYFANEIKKIIKMN